MFIIDGMHFSYSTYRYTSFIIPLVLLSAILVGLMVAIYSIILVSWPFKRLVSKEFPTLTTELTGGKKIPCWTFIFGGLKLIYGHHIKECEHPGQTNIYTICGRHVRPWLLIILFLVVVFVHSCTAVSFWCEFLIDESNHCDKHMDCFALNGTTLLEIEEDQQPLQNCSEYELQKYTIHCFRFSFDYATAIGNAGGVLVWATLVMNIQAGLWIGASSQQRKCAWYVCVAVVAAFNILVELLLIATPIIVQFVPLLHNRVAGTSRTSVKFYTYWATFLFTFTISGPLFIVFSKRLRSRTQIHGEEQYVSVNSSRRLKLTQSAANTDSESEEDLSFGKDHKHKLHKEHCNV